MTSIISSSLVLRGTLGRRARLRSGELLLRSGREVRRIPVAAIERVEVRGLRGRTLVVVLTGQEPDAARTHRFASLRPTAVKRFATVLREALPVRDTAELALSGPSLVRVEALERPGLPSVRWDVAVVVAFFLVLAALLITRSWTGAVLWPLVPTLVGAGVSLTELGWKPVREGWILAVRGITVDGRRENSGSVDAGDSDASYVYLFTDAEGAMRAYRGTNGGRDEEEILYDPRNPGVNQLRRRNAAQFVIGLVLLVVLVLPLLGGGVALGLSILADLFGFVPVTVF
ncbi:hypothetical protein ACFYNX_24285 [Streptomyces sp. NPDC007872]|uniref:hypothetical protein n=1 Tax=Streptomyces sp. NPDC007872 TaxID=3364782 RepID=UPI0036CC7EB4